MRIARAGIGVVLGFALATTPLSAQNLIELVSKTATTQGESDAARPRMSAEGRYIAFATASAAFDATDTNGLIDVYVKDRVIGTVTRISKGPAGALAVGGHSGWNGFGFDIHALAISEDGDRIAFLSDATNLVAGDGNAKRDAFLWDRGTNTVVLVSRTSGGTPANDNCTHVAISGDGSLVAFSSFATDLVASDTNATLDLFGYTVSGGAIERINLTDADAQMPPAPSADRGAKEASLSRDGRYVAFISEANAPDLGVTDCAGQCAETWVRDRVAQTTVQASRFSGEAGTAAGTTVNPHISADGRYVVWYSSARMALPDVAGGTLDVFLRDLQAGVTEHISHTTDGAVGHVGCGWPGVSEGGRFVTFNCNGIFGPDDTLNGNDVYVRDRSLHQTLRYSVSTTQGQPGSVSELPVISPDGQWLLFESAASNLVPGDANGRRDAFLVRNPFLFDPPSRIGSSEGSVNDASELAGLSDDGRYLFFETTEPLVAGDINGEVDIYRRDLASGALERVSVADNEGEIGAGGNDYAVSADGTRIVFIALDDGSVALKGEPVPRATGKLTPIAAAFLRNMITGTTQRMGPIGIATKQPTISKDGTRVAFVTGANGVLPGDANGMDDVYVADAVTGAVTARASASVSGDANGASTDPAMSADGNVVVFATDANNLVTAGTPDTNNFADIIRVNLALAQRLRMSVTPTQQGNGASVAPTVSSDGRYVAFASDASNLGGMTDANNQRDVILVDAVDGVPTLLSTGAAGAGNAASGTPGISSDGTTIAFSSAASDLVGSDLNAKADVFVVDRATRIKRRIARSDGGTQTNGDSDRPQLSRDGQHVAFQSLATNLSLLDANGVLSDVFVNGPLDPDRIFRSRFE